MAIVEAVLQEPVFEFLNLEAMCRWEALLYRDQFNFSGLVNLAEEEMGEDDDLQDEYKVHTVWSLASGRWVRKQHKLGEERGLRALGVPGVFGPCFPRLASPPRPLEVRDSEFPQAVVAQD